MSDEANETNIWGQKTVAKTINERDNALQRIASLERERDEACEHCSHCGCR